MFRRGPLSTLCAVLLGAAALLSPTQALAGSPFLEVPPEEEVKESSSYRYANMTNEQAFAELERRGVPFTREKVKPGVRAPVRLSGKLNGVWIHSSLPAEERKDSMFEVLDARLALALDDFSLILARYDVVEVVHYTMYRPNVAAPGSKSAASKAAASKDADDKKDKKVEKKAEEKPAGKTRSKRRASLNGKATKAGKTRKPTTSGKNKDIDLDLFAKPVFGSQAEGDEASFGELQKGSKARAKPPAKPAPKPPPKVSRRGTNAKKKLAQTNGEHSHGKWAPPGTRHPAGLAIDIGTFIKSDGSQLHVASHFKGKIGDRTCGSPVTEPDTTQAKELRNIVCDARAAGVFTYALTPNFDAAHADHFHLEIKPATKWFLYH